jgi:hypothetical protein
MKTLPTNAKFSWAKQRTDNFVINSFLHFKLLNLQLIFEYSFTATTHNIARKWMSFNEFKPGIIMNILLGAI